MKRKTFLRTSMAASAMISFPFNLLANTTKNYRDKGGYMVEAGKDRFGKSISLLEGDIFTCKVSTKDTDGDMYVFESIRIKEGGPSYHLHFEQDEWWYVLAGEFIIKVGEKTYQAKAGDSVFGPRNVPHAFAKVGEAEGKLLITFQPAGKMEEFFHKLSSGAAKGMTEEQQDKFREEHGFKRVGPALKDFKKW